MRTLFAVVLVAGLAANDGPATALGGRPLTTCARWKVIPSPTLSNAGLADISGVSTTDIWAVGGYYQTNPPIIEHWDGTAWTLVDQPATGGILTSVVAISSDDVWAVGGTGFSEHWDGVSWRLVHIHPPGDYFLLYGVDAVSSNDVWAVGYYEDYMGGHPAAEHWDGTSWSVVPTAGLGALFLGVSAVASDDVWAVGWQNIAFGVYQPLIEHWDGTAWTIADSPSPLPGDDNQLTAVAAVSSTDVWAVGFYGAGQAKPLVEHWNGSSWSKTRVPTPKTGGHELFGVAAASPNDVWVVGKSLLQYDFRPLTEHWDGTAWTRVDAPTPGQTAVFGSVTTIGSGDVWATGYYTDLTPAIPLIEHSKGCQGT